MSLVNPHMNEGLKTPTYDVRTAANYPKRFIDTLSLQVFCDRLKKEGVDYKVVDKSGSILSYY